MTKPREQVTDAETLLDMANTLVTTVKAYSKDGLTSSAFISSLLRDFSASGSRLDDDRVSIKWDAIGVRVCPIFKKALGCATMYVIISVVLQKICVFSGLFHVGSNLMGCDMFLCCAFCLQ